VVVQRFYTGRLIAIDRQPPAKGGKHEPQVPSTGHVRFDNSGFTAFDFIANVLHTFSPKLALREEERAKG
jgi:hypothetical protein